MRRRRGHTLKPIRTVLLGKDGVGKSALTVRFLTRRFIGEYDQTLENTYSHHVQVDNEDIPVDICDTAGENTDEKLRQCLRQGDLFLVLYSIADRSSFDEAKRIGKFLKEARNVDSMALVIVGTKCDLEHFREVEFDEGCELSDQLECHFYEVSNAEGYKEVQDLLRAFLRNFLRRRDKKETLKIPSATKRTPSLERKKRPNRHSQEHSKSFFSLEKNREQTKEDGDGCNAEHRVNNNTPSAQDGHSRISSSREGARQENGGPFTARIRGPFNVESIKGSSREKRRLLPSSDHKSSSLGEHPKLPSLIKVQRVKGSSASEWMRPLPADMFKAPLLSDRAKDRPNKTKGPFFIDKLRSQSPEKIRTTATNEKSRSSSSLSRVKEGFNLIGKTRSLRRKPIVL